MQKRWLLIVAILYTAGMILLSIPKSKDITEDSDFYNFYRAGYDFAHGNEIDPHRTLKTHYESVVQEHDTILESLRRRDAEGLKQIIFQHISMFQERIIRYIAA